MEPNEAGPKPIEKFDVSKFIKAILPQPPRMNLEDDDSSPFICCRFDVDMGIYWDLKEKLMLNATIEMEELASKEYWGLRSPLAGELSDAAPIGPSRNKQTKNTARQLKKPGPGQRKRKTQCNKGNETVQNEKHSQPAGDDRAI